MIDTALPPAPAGGQPQPPPADTADAGAFGAMLAAALSLPAPALSKATPVLAELGTTDGEQAPAEPEESSGTDGEQAPAEPEGSTSTDGEHAPVPAGTDATALLALLPPRASGGEEPVGPAVGVAVRPGELRLQPVTDDVPPANVAAPDTAPAEASAQPEPPVTESGAPAPLEPLPGATAPPAHATAPPADATVAVEEPVAAAPPPQDDPQGPVLDHVGTDPAGPAPAAGPVPEAQAAHVRGSADGGPVESPLARRIADTVELLEHAPPPRRLTLDLDDLGMRVTVSLRSDGVHVDVAPNADQRPPGNWLRDVEEALSERGFALADHEGSDHRRRDDDVPESPDEPGTNLQSRPRRRPRRPANVAGWRL